MAALAGLALWNQEVFSVHKELAAAAGVVYETFENHKQWLKAVKAAGILREAARREASRRRGTSIAAERAERWFAKAVEDECMGLPMTVPKTYRDRQIHKYRLQIQSSAEGAAAPVAAPVASPVAKPPQPAPRLSVMEPAKPLPAPQPKPLPAAKAAEPKPLPAAPKPEPKALPSAPKPEPLPAAEPKAAQANQDPAYLQLLADGFDEVILGGNPYYRNIETGDLFVPAPNYQLGDAMPAWDADLGEFLPE